MANISTEYRAVQISAPLFFLESPINAFPKSVRKVFQLNAFAQMLFFKLNISAGQSLLKRKKRNLEYKFTEWWTWTEKIYFLKKVAWKDRFKTTFPIKTKEKGFNHFQLEATHWQVERNTLSQTLDLLQQNWLIKSDFL